MRSTHLIYLQRLLLVLAGCVFTARFLGVLSLPAVNSTFNWLLGRPVLVAVLDQGGVLAGFEEMWLRLIDALVWAAAVLLSGIVVLFTLPPTVRDSQ